MPVNPVSGASDPSEISGQAEFEGALESARAAAAEDDLPEGFEDAMVEGMVVAGGQMIIMPRANEILGEVMSDD